MSARLAGHELRHEGAPYDEAGRRLNVIWGGTSGTGRGKCSYGKLSAALPSGNMRKAWHRAHKAEVRAEQESQP